jgi:DNA-binding response OmpR family regulator
MPSPPNTTATARHGHLGHILIVEDERQIARFIELELIHEGYRVTLATNGIEALIQAREQQPDLVVLDLMIPGIDGLEVCRRLRGGAHPARTLPILIVTARDSVPDRVAGLHTGADDYLTKPFAIEELLARITALLRRSRSYDSAGADWLVCADLRVSTITREVYRGDAPIELTAKEYDLLVYLLRHARQILTREQIYDAVWGYDFEGESNVIEVYIRYLRNKLDTQGAKLIHTIRGVGYVLRDDRGVR